MNCPNSIKNIINSKFISNKRIENKRDFIECFSWSLKNYKENISEDLSLYECAERNNHFRKIYIDYYQNNDYINDQNKLDNNFYRNSQLRYDAVIPLNIYNKIVNHIASFIDDDKNIDKSKFIIKNIDRIFMFCSVLYYRQSRYKNRNLKKIDFTQLPYQLVKSILGTNFNEIMDYLCNDIKIVIWDKSYIPGIYDKTGNNSGLCRSFKFVEPCNGNFQHRIHDKVLIKKIYSDDDIEIRHVNNESKVVKNDDLNDYFSKNFTLSHDAYKNKNIDLEGFTRYISKLNSDENEKFKRFKIGRDVFGTRLYNPFLYLKKDLRKYITINGSSNITNVDINNSHPYFFSMLFDEKFLNSVKHLLNDTEYEIFHSFSKNKNFVEKIDIFQKITSSGSYYSYLLQSMNIPINDESIKNIKKTNMFYFYGRINKNNKIYKYFDDNFDFINIVKHAVIKHSSYKRLCQILQRVEAYVLIDGVFDYLRPLISFIPLHDGFLCKSEDEEIIVNTLKKKLKKLNVKYLPSCNKSATLVDLNKSIEKIKLKHCNLFINKNILFKQLNEIILLVGIKNRVFREGMKKTSIEYIDRRFEEQREFIPDEIANIYYDFRIKLENNDYVCFDFTPYFDEYMKCSLTKKKFYGKSIVDIIKINPVEFLNKKFNTSDRTRVKEKNYIYN